MEECYCPSCGVVKCPRELWGGECDCEHGMCWDCQCDLHDKHCSSECTDKNCNVWEAIFCM